MMARMTPGFQTLTDAAAWYGAWLREAALPLWSTAGVDAEGGFYDALTANGEPCEAPRRARVQARNTFVFAQAALARFEGPWLQTAWRGFESFLARYRRPDGLFVSTVDAGGRVLDDTPALYEQDFALLAMAALYVADASRMDLLEAAAKTRRGLQALRHPAGGFREFGPHPFQANAHMHLLEAALAWEDAGVADWAPLSDEVAALALTCFIDPERGFLREFFDARWRPASGDDGRWVEPGHQFEWAWLLERWGARRRHTPARTAARKLFQHGLAGVDRRREVAVNILWDDLSVRDGSARLWPQTEYLKAALLFGEEAEALTAARGLAKYLDVPARGAWRDKMQPDGSFADEPAPASSLYHLTGAALALLRATGRLPNGAVLLEAGSRLAGREPTSRPPIKPC